MGTSSWKESTHPDTHVSSPAVALCVAIYNYGSLTLSYFLRWDESTLWSQGTLVRHSKDLYKAEGIATAAEPGNSVHGRFYVSSVGFLYNRKKN